MEYFEFANKGSLIKYGIAVLSVCLAYLYYKIRRNRPTVINGNSTFIITGAGSGIGRITSKILVQNYQAKLILVDKNKESIKSLSEELGAENTAIYECDLTKINEITEFVKWVENNFDNVSGLVQFAGVTHGKTFLEANLSEIDLVMSVNLSAIIRLTRLLLPVILKNNPDPILMMISSIAGLIGVAGMVDYCASKHGVNGFCDSLRQELKQTHPNVCISCIQPYFINTGMFEGIQGTVFSELDRNSVSTRIVQAIRNREENVIIPAYMGVLLALHRILPQVVLDIADRFIGMSNVMRGYIGRGGNR